MKIREWGGRYLYWTIKSDGGEIWTGGVHWYIRHLKVSESDCSYSLHFNYEVALFIVRRSCCASFICHSIRQLKQMIGASKFSSLYFCLSLSPYWYYIQSYGNLHGLPTSLYNSVYILCNTLVLWPSFPIPRVNFSTNVINEPPYSPIFSSFLYT